MALDSFGPKESRKEWVKNEGLWLCAV